MGVAAVLVAAWVSLVCFHTHKSLGPGARRICRKLTSWESVKKDNEQQQYVRMMVQEMREKRTMSFAKGWAFFYPLVVMASIPALWEVRKNPIGYTIFFEEHLWFEGLLFSIYGFLVACRQQSKNVEAVGLHLVLSACFCLRMCTFSQEHSFHHGVFIMSLARLGLAVTTNPIVTAAMNTCLAAFEVFIVLYNGIWGIHRAAGVLVFVCTFSWGLERSLESEVEAKVAAEVAKEGRARVHDVLSHVCDAVLELDETFIIAAESPNFGAIVLQGRSCHGRCFIDFILDEDRPPLLQFLQSNSEGNVNSCSARLVIPSSNMVKVTIWHCFSMRRHLIGVQEDPQDICRGPLPPLQGEPWQRNQSKKRRQRSDHNHGTTALQTLSTDTLNSEPDGTTVQQTLPPDTLNSKPDAIVVKVRADQVELPIIELTVGAQLLLGPCAGIGSSLARFVTQQDPFVRWLQEVMNHYLSGDLDEAAQVNRTIVTLQAHTSRTPVPFTCSITWADSELYDATMPLFLVFSPLSESNSSSSSSSSSSSADFNCGSSTRRGRCGSRRSHSTDSDQPCSGSLAHGS